MPSKAVPLIAATFPFFAACHTAPASSAPAEAAATLTSATATQGDGMAVVELFTSEGCSSCPSADAVLGEMVRARDPHVFPLAFHVDYWNSLGWTDRFSSPAWSERQRQYADAFGTSSVYTPQMIVGGTDPFTGSDSSHAASSIRKSVETETPVRVAVSVDAKDAKELSVRFHTESAPSGAWINVALVERSLVTHVKNGENGGRTLPHENVVRAFATQPIRERDGTLVLRVPDDVDRGHAEVFGYVQSPARSGQRGLPILAAARTGVRPAT